VSAIAPPILDSLHPAALPPTDTLIPIGDLIAPPIVPPGTILSPIDAVTASTPPDLGAATTPDPIVSLGGATDALSGLDLNEILPMAGSLGIAALGTAVIVRGVLSPSPSILFTNVRLLPWYVNATVHQSTAAATSIVSRVGDDVAAVNQRFGGGGLSVGSLRDGIERAVRRTPFPVGDEARDGRLIAQIGIVLGTIYMAFLTLWFWATRLRWNPRV
jgi:hypothetical protein